eukprot:CAMPEP_0178371752 /NCGR_PEP_ID=MMETSP0689_2-20121128/990_1 /TAXON_ID=160604 /ORGANISM="Amphidinium massartii, Strain CS-259" /LENGTH=733 /DNA_ID=CAMNT_0019991635 /DNA_START=54 /DNA_END=2252 /DNA_ORIENTATION=-
MSCLADAEAAERLSGLYKCIGSLKLRIIAARSSAEKRALQEQLHIAIGEQTNLVAQLARGTLAAESDCAPRVPALAHPGAGAEAKDCSLKQEAQTSAEPLTHVASPAAVVAAREPEWTSECDTLVAETEGTDELVSASTIIAIEEASVSRGQRSATPSEAELPGISEVKVSEAILFHAAPEVETKIADAVAAALSATATPPPSPTKPDVEEQVLVPAPPSPEALEEMAQLHFVPTTHHAHHQHPDHLHLQDDAHLLQQGVASPADESHASSPGTCTHSQSASAVLALQRLLPASQTAAVKEVLELIGALEKETQASHKEREALERRARKLAATLQATQARCSKLEKAEEHRNKASQEAARLRKALSSHLAEGARRRRSDTEQMLRQASAPQEKGTSSSAVGSVPVASFVPPTAVASRMARACHEEGRSLSQPAVQRQKSACGGAAAGPAASMSAAGGWRPPQLAAPPWETYHEPTLRPGLDETVYANGPAPLGPSLEQTWQQRSEAFAAAHQQVREAFGPSMDRMRHQGTSGLMAWPPQATIQTRPIPQSRAPPPPAEVFRSEDMGQGRAFVWEMPSEAGDSLLAASDCHSPPLEFRESSAAGRRGAPGADQDHMDLSISTAMAHPDDLQAFQEHCTWSQSLEGKRAFARYPEDVYVGLNGAPLTRLDSNANEPILPPTPPGGDARDTKQLGSQSKDVLSFRQSQLAYTMADWQRSPELTGSFSQQQQQQQQQ